MGSTLALWAYHRRLSLDAQRIKNQEVARRESLTTPTVSNYSRKPTTGRTESECSTASQPVAPRDRKVSWKTEDSSSDEDDEEEQPHSKPAESNQKRRFSLDFIFSRNKKKKPKVSRKRSQSVAVGHEDDHSEVKDHKYPGIHNSDFAALYFF